MNMMRRRDCVMDCVLCYWVSAFYTMKTIHQVSRLIRLITYIEFDFIVRPHCP